MKHLVMNAAAAEGKKNLQSLICNLLPKQVRNDSMEGRAFVVVPMVIMTEGVHAGSDGPLLYPKEELAKTPAVWNHKPIVVYHPEMNGVGVSACSPDIITSRKVGVMMNTRFEKGKLKSEAWIEASRADAVDVRIMEAVRANEMMELSTGLFVDNDAEEGEWNGEAYVGIARNYRPDHLALLPDKIGACSISDGAGFLRNESRGKEETEALLRRMLRTLGVVGNELSHSNLHSELTRLLRERFGISNKIEQTSYLFVQDVYSNFVVYETTGGKLFRLGYTATDTGATLSDGEPVPVVRVTEYRTVEGAFVGNRNQNQNQNEMKDKRKLVDGIIGNAGWTETDRPVLDAFTSEQLTLIHNAIHAKPAESNPTEAPKAEPVKNEAPKAEPVTTEAPKAEPVKNEAPKVVTLEDYVNAAPAEVAEVLRNGVAAHNTEKAKLVDTILANKANPFAKEDLQNRPLGELRNLAALAGAAAPANYAGQAPVGNTGGEDPLVAPVLNFEKKA